MFGSGFGVRGSGFGVRGSRAYYHPAELWRIWHASSRAGPVCPRLRAVRSRSAVGAAATCARPAGSDGAFPNRSARSRDPAAANVGRSGTHGVARTITICRDPSDDTACRGTGNARAALGSGVLEECSGRCIHRPWVFPPRSDNGSVDAHDRSTALYPVVPNPEPRTSNLELRTEHEHEPRTVNSEV